MKKSDLSEKVFFPLLLIILLIAVILALSGCDAPAVKGPKGDKGSTCSVQPVAEGALITCPDGTSTLVPKGTDGSDGATGPKGDTGGAGAPGADGQDATPVTIVQFCGGTTTYPSVFTEVGFCIDHKLYAVYSEHDGFLVYVPPGAYRSNAHNSSCTFTVQEDCAVTH